MTSSARTRRARDGAALDEGPQPLTDRRRQHAFEILQRGPLQLLVVRIEAAKRNLQRLSRQHQRQQREDVREAFTGPRPDELVERRRAVALVGAVQQPPALPYASAHGDLPENDGEDLRAVDLDERVLLDNRRQRPGRLEPDVEPRIVETEHQTAGGALRDAHREHACQTPPDGEVLVGIEQRVDELTDPLLRHLAEREQRVVGDLVPCQQVIACGTRPAVRPSSRERTSTTRARSRDRRPRMSRTSGSSDAGSIAWRADGPSVCRACDVNGSAPSRPSSQGGRIPLTVVFASIGSAAARRENRRGCSRACRDIRDSAGSRPTGRPPST